MATVTIMDHPLIQHKLGIMRRKTTSTKEFRDLVSEVAMLICYEATRHLPLTDIEIETPLTKCMAKEIEGKKLCIVPILRAGLGMVDGFLQLVPAAKVGHIGLYRDPDSHKPIAYYCKLPQDIQERDVIVLDPMLATGGSAISAVKTLKEHGCKSIKFFCLLAAPEGIKAFSDEFPDIDVYTAVIDDHLNEHCYIVPGLGDAGDRLFGTR
jgi:uracil phosphoribosyltransferase